VATASAAPRRSRAEGVLIGLAAVIGVLIVLYRNGAVAAAFAATGNVKAYESMEAALGGPALGTPRAVEALVQQPAAAAPGPAR
jgi:hypothetical protein